MPVSFSAIPPAQLFYGQNDTLAPLPLFLAWTQEGALAAVAFLGKGRSVKNALASFQKRWPETQWLAAKNPWTRRAHFLMVGTPFQQKVWAALQTIPSGQTISYGALACQIGHPKAARAVGQALGANPLPFFFPCHRVLATGGKIGGFSGGEGVKQLLLKEEGATVFPAS